MKNAGSLEEGKKLFDEVRFPSIQATMQNLSHLGETLEGRVGGNQDGFGQWQCFRSEDDNSRRGELDADPALPHQTFFFQADKAYAANIKRWEAVDKAIKEWITKMEALVKMWEDQAGNYF